MTSKLEPREDVGRNARSSAAASELEPLDSDVDGERDIKGAVFCLGLMGPPFPSTEWVAKIQGVWWYRVSSFAYCIPGSLAAVRPEPLMEYVSCFSPRHATTP